MTTATRFLAEMNITAMQHLGEVKATIQLENYGEAEIARAGLWNPDRVHRASVEMVVDTGSTMLVIPESLVRRLGLPTTRQIVASYSDGRKEIVSVAGVVTVRWEDRETRVECVVGSDDIPPLLGQIPLEGLDVLVDCQLQRLVGRDPSGPVMRV